MTRSVRAVAVLGCVLLSGAACTNSATRSGRSESHAHGHRHSDASTTAALSPPAPTGPTSVADPTCPGATITVRDADGLTAALRAARPGTAIHLADGTYTGKFVADRTGTRAQPIFLCGGPGAVLDGDGVRGGYVLHLDHVAYWRVVGFTVRNGQKGVVADSTQHSVIASLAIHDIGDEAIHLRAHSSDDIVAHNTISGTGKRRDKFGEGVYVGTAKSNWCTYSDCQPDPCNRNLVIGNHISDTTAESVDLKEGTSLGVVAGNTFDGSALSGADSWVDAKGTSWLISGNTGSSSPADGFQTHQIVDGAGEGNVFTKNIADVHGPGYGFHLAPIGTNVVRCDNKVVDAKSGLTNTDCTR